MKSVQNIHGFQILRTFHVNETKEASVYDVASGSNITPCFKNRKKHLGDNCIQNFHLGRYIVGYTVGNLVLRRHACGALKRDFRTYIRRYTSPNENFEYGYPHSNALLQFRLESERWKQHKAARHPTRCDVINDVKLFPTVYCSISHTVANFDVIQSDVALQNQVH